MAANIPAPARGSDILPWAQAVTDVCRRFGGIGSANLLVREGPGGIGYETLPQNKRSRTAILPWTFSSTEDDAGNRTGGWRNCRLQIGYNGWLVSPDLNTPDMLSGVAEIGGTDRTDDGIYVVEVDVSKETAVIMLRSEISHRYPVDPEASVVYVDIGQVKDGVQKTRIPCNPVVYKYV